MFTQKTRLEDDEEKYYYSLRPTKLYLVIFHTSNQCQVTLDIQLNRFSLTECKIQMRHRFVGSKYSISLMVNKLLKNKCEKIARWFFFLRKECAYGKKYPFCCWVDSSTLSVLRSTNIHQSSPKHHRASSSFSVLLLAFLRNLWPKFSWIIETLPYQSKH